MSALPYIPLFVADYLADTSHLSTLEHGAYLLLIMNYWQRGQALPGADAALARIARVNEKEWAKIRPSIAPFFDVVEDTWTHGRIEEELGKVKSKSEISARAGKASAAARAQRKGNGRSTDVEQTFNHTERDTDSDTEREREEKAALTQDPKHWAEVQSLLKDRTSDLTDWEVDFLHSIKWAETLTKAQASSLKAIIDKFKSPAHTGADVFVVKAGTPEFAAWIEFKRAQGLKVGFLESQREITVPSLLPPNLRAA